MRPIRNFRWWIAGLLTLATALNYLDRQSFPVAVGVIKQDIPISDAQYGQLSSLFLLAYAIMYAGGGRLMDWLGTRAGYALMIAWWSLANFLMGTVTSVFGLGVCRFLLGMGEGGGFPGSAKAVADWFPPKERATACGLFNTGSAVGALIAPPLIAVIITQLGWRWVFFLTGAAGLVLTVIWWKLYRSPAASPHLGPEERQMLAVAADTPSAAAARPLPWLRLLAWREVQGLMLAKFLTDAAWFFYIFWLPKYLGDVRHLDIAQIGYFAWIPYTFAGLGSLTGGFFSDLLLRRGATLDRARKIALGLSAVLMPFSLLIAGAPLFLALALFSLAMFAHQFWSANMQTLPTDLFPAHSVGSVGGLLGSAGSFGGMLFGLAVGSLVGTHGYGPVFLVAGAMHPIAFLLILLSVRRIGPLATAAAR